ncbi:homeobox protein 2-like [Aphis craccivora]|uniref:Homeobox protein 2-like n=1 Tax=Aphis craccivora TaxID=307492 RepID=A0A6G0Y593_APHCR|nr:homeobox protein 2-like [Aphis craccivora]
MHGAGKRTTRPPDRYNSSSTYHSPILPSTDFDLTMGENDDTNLSLLGNSSPLSFTSLKKLIDDMNGSFHQQLDNFAHKFTELDNKFDELCDRVDEIDTDHTSKLTQIQTNFHSDFITVQNSLTELQNANDTSRTATANESINHINSVQRNINSSIQALTDRLCCVEGQSSRVLISITPSQTSFNNILSSTAVPIPSQPKHTLNEPHTTTNLSQTLTVNTSSIALDTSRIPQYDGMLTPIHPADFLEKVDQYFSIIQVLDQRKINFVSDNFIHKARLWYDTLLPPPSNFKDFVCLFRNYFWSNSLQRSIRNELYRPHFHRDYSTMTEHAMNWINQARHLQPPIDQTEMMDQITSHFSYNIALALRGLRITTTNDLIQQLTYLQCAHAPSNNNNNNNTPSNSRQQNSYHNTSGQNAQHRYPTRQQNNYNRPHHNNIQPSQSNHNVPPPEN